MRYRRRIHVFASRFHKWLAVIIGAQLLIWFASGALVSSLPIDRVRGEHLVDREAVAPISAGLHLRSPDIIIAQASAPAEATTWRMLAERPVAEVTTAQGAALFDAETGKLPTPVDAATAMRIAQAAWNASESPPATASRVTEESPEYRAALHVWRLAFGDPDRTSVFIAANTGRIIAVRTSTWRLYDFFWSLHIMSWKNHVDFNTWGLLAFGVGGLTLGLAGTGLLIFRWPARHVRRLA